MTEARGSGAGAATSGGVTYEHRVAALYAAYILAGESRIPGLAPDALGAQVWLQSDEPLDDVKVVDMLGDEVLIQAKRSLEAGAAAESEFAKICDQLVRAHRESSERARLLIAVGRDTGRPIAQRLATVLRRAREQPLDAAPRLLAPSQAEKSVYDIFTTHLRRVARARGVSAGATELRALMRRTEVRMLDVEHEGTDERYAIRALERDVVREPAQAPAAWAALLEICGELDRRRSHLDRAGFQAALQSRQIALREPPDLRAEISALRARSTEHLQRVRSRAAIRLGEREIRIRRAVAATVADRALKGSLAVVGDAGSGKTGCTYDAIERLRSSGVEVVVLAADLLEAHNDASLAAEIRINRPLDELLTAWPTERGVLVLDGLDAARDDATRRTLTRLVERVANARGRFTVLASLRTFDLRNSVTLAEALPAAPGEGHAYRREEFEGVEHVFIPALTDGELLQLRTLAPALHAVLQSAPAAVRELAAVPFNLSLLAELVLTSNVEPAQLRSIDTQVALLEAYWHRRVRGTESGDDREYLLRKACEAMVAARRLYADRRELQGPSNRSLLALLHDHLLVEDLAQGRETVAFSHNLLYDYAVARLLFRVPADQLVARLREDPSLLLSARPSLDLHFRWLWDHGTDRTAFWEATQTMAKPHGLRAIGKTIAPAIVVELAQAEADLEPLLAELSEQEASTRSVAEDVLRQIVGAFVAVAPDDLTARGDVWPRVTCRLALRLSTATAHGVKILIHHQLTDPSGPGNPALGTSARSLLRWAWDQPARDGVLVIAALMAVVTTLATDPTESEALLREAIEPDHLARFGHEELPRLLQEPEPLIEFAPAFLADCYTATFSYDEQSDEPTALYDSRIMPLMSSRKQDYRMARWQLGQAFPEFLERRPRAATRALVAMAGSAAATRGHPATAEPPLSVRWRQKAYRIQPDGSSIWDSGGGFHEEVNRALTTFNASVEKRAVTSAGDVATIFDTLADAPVPAAVLAHIFQAAARAPSNVPFELAALLAKPRVLALVDLQYGAGLYLGAVHPLLPTSSRARVEQAVLRVPREFGPDRAGVGEDVRDMYVGTLASAAIVTPPMRKLHRDVQAVGAPALQPPFSFAVRSATSADFEGLLSERGIDTSNAANQRLLDDLKPLMKLDAEDPRARPAEDARGDAITNLRRVWRRVTGGSYEGAQEGVIADARLHIASAAERLSQAPGVLTDAQGQLVADILIAGIDVPFTHSFGQWDEVDGWSPHPRISAAEGLPQLSREPRFATGPVLAAIERLAADRAPEVRFHVIARLGALQATAPDVAWRLADRTLVTERSASILSRLAGALLSLLHADSGRALAMATRVLDREWRRREPRKEVMDNYLGLLIAHYIWNGSDEGRHQADRLAKHLTAMPDTASSILHQVRETIFHGPVEPANPAHTEIRRRALGFMELLVTTSLSGVRALVTQHDDRIGGPEWTDADTTKLRNWLDVLRHATDQLYFASGVFQERHPSPQDRYADLAQRARLYHEATDIIHELAGLGEASTTHHLIEMLAGCIDTDPPGVFLLIADAVRSSATWGYQFESLGQALVVGVVQRYLGERREIFRDDTQLEDALIDVLDIFVDAGWPEARRLVYALPEIFR